MADAWGGAWGAAWGSSWGAGVTPPVPSDAGVKMGARIIPSWPEARYGRDKTYERRKRQSYKRLQKQLDEHAEELERLEEERPQAREIEPEPLVLVPDVEPRPVTPIERDPHIDRLIQALADARIRTAKQLRAKRNREKVEAELQRAAEIEALAEQEAQDEEDMIAAIMAAEQHADDALEKLLAMTPLMIPVLKAAQEAIAKRKKNGRLH